MRLSWIMCAVLVGCGGEIAQPDAAGVDAGGVANDGGRLCARASECDDGLYCNGVENCVDTLCVAGTPPCDPVAQRCDEAGARCSAIACTPEKADMDEDNHRSNACGGDDCDDDDGNRYTGNHEVCDTAGHDEDCDPDTFGFRDLDMDGEPDAACCNGDVCGSDCDDSRPNVSPRAPEVCGNGLDDDCDGMMDEDLLVDGFADADGDGWGDSMLSMTGVCAGTPGFAAMGGDCDEGDPAINPGATEACDTIDNDCDGMVDDGLPAMRCYRDEDGDGYGVTSDFEMRCSCGSGWTPVPGDCFDRALTPTNSHPPLVHPGSGFRPGGWCDPAPGTVCLYMSGANNGDWNCDGVEERRYLTACRGWLCGVGGDPHPCWLGNVVPGCDERATWQVCTADGTSTHTTRSQECR